jgi:predicted dehydrogenase
LRAAIVGPGSIASTHVDALRRLGVRLQAVVGREPKRARELAALWQAPLATDNLQEALAVVDTVHICSPNHLHREQVAAALEAGRHVLCEKPMTPTLREAQELVALARECDLEAAVNFTYRGYPMVSWAREQVAAGALGRVTQVRGSYLADELLGRDAYHWRLDPEQGGPSNAFADVGIHWMDLAEWVLGDHVTELCADFHTPISARTWKEGAPGHGRRPRGASVAGATAEVTMSLEDCAGVLFGLESGARGLLAINQVSAGNRNTITLEVEGTEGALRWYQLTPDVVQVCGPEGRWQSIEKDAAKGVLPETSRPRLPPGHPEGYLDAARNVMAGFYQAVAARREGARSTATYPTFADGARAAALTEAALDSAHRRAWVAVS